MPVYKCSLLLHDRIEAASEEDAKREFAHRLNEEEDGNGFINKIKTVEC